MTIVYSHYGIPTISELISSIIPSYLSLKVIFTKPMTNDSELINPENYYITVSDPTTAFDFEIISVTPESVANPNYIILETTDCTHDKEYTFVIVPDKIKTSTEEYITAGLNTIAFNGVSELPNILSVIPITSSSVRITFSKKMAKNSSLLDNSSYAFTGGLKVLSVEQENPYSVLLTTSVQTSGEIYNLTVG